ncbi:hypothetical protein AB832_00255, partial [Flavobacteriaceae bacterium (ex Bugula neritina AB1)]
SIPSYTYLINNCGEIVNQWSSQFQAFGNDYISEDGSLYSVHIDNQSTLNLPGTTGRIEKKDWNNNLLWGFTYSDTDFSFHHDFSVLPNGNILLLVAHRRTTAQALENGADPTIITNDGDLYEEKIIEIRPIGTNDAEIVWEWSLWDHLIQDIDNTINNFGVVSDHPELLNINYSLTEGNWIHANAIDYNSSLDQIILNSRNLNEFYIIDHSTTTAEASSHTGGNSGKGGDFLYRWGNPITYNQGTNQDQKSFGQHTTHWIPKGFPDEDKIMFFNNGGDRAFSSIDIIMPPIDQNGNYTNTPNTPFLPITAEWSYIDQTNSQDFFARILSGAYRLQNGNTFITYGTAGILFEVDANFNTVWKYINPVSSSTLVFNQGDDPNGMSTTIFRARKYNTDYIGFSGKDLTPLGNIEQNPIPENCSLFDSLSNEDFQTSIEFSIFPNPSSNKIHIISLNKQKYTIELYNLNGLKIESKLVDNMLDISQISSGVYIIKISSENQSLTKKIIKK